MSEDSTSFAELFQESESKSVRRLKPGQKITATIVGISGETIFLDTSGKSEGILDALELQNDDKEIAAAVGDKLEVYFLKTKNVVFFSPITIRFTLYHQYWFRKKYRTPGRGMSKWDPG